MAGNRPAVTRLTSAAAGLGVGVALSIVGIGAAPAAADEDGLRYETHALYELDRPAHVVHVAVDIALTNEQPDEVTGNFIREFYLPDTVVPVLTEATNFAATRDDGTPLDVSTEAIDLPLVMLARIDLKPDLYYGHTANIHLTYDLPSLGPRSPGVTRINDAFASFTVFVLGDPGITSVEVVLPKGYDVEVVGDDMTFALEGDKVVYRADAIADPYLWQSSIVARDDTKLIHHVVSVLGHDVEVQAWPDDQPWADFVNDRLENSLPALQELVGQPWPDDVDDLVVTETVSPYLYGYAGWYLPSGGLLEIGDELEPVVVLHELAHMWFNDRIFADRWVNEGFAEEYATRTLEQLGEPLKEPTAVDAAAPGALRLNAWSTPNLQNEISDDQETFGYNTSWFVVRTLYAEVGADGMAEVIDAAADHTISYRGDAEPEKQAGTVNWQRLLDLLDEVAGSQQADGLFATYVVSDADAATFQERTDTRAAYHALADAGGSWTPPLGVRQEVTRWHFAKARALIATATSVLDERAAIAAIVEPAGLKVPPALEHAYESGEHLAEVVTAAQEDHAAAEELVRAHDARRDHHGFWENIGLKGSGVGGTLDDADRAFADGKPDDAIEDAKAVERLVADADTEGKKRVGLAGGAVLLLVAVTVPLRRAVRHDRASVGSSELGVVPRDDVDRDEDNPAPG